MGSTIGLLARLVLSLGIVLALMAAAAAVLRRGGGPGMGRRRGLPVEVLARQPMGRRASIALVRAGGRGLVLGVTDHTVTVLAEADPDELVPPQIEQQAGTPAASGPPWTAFLENLRDRTARR